MPARWVEPILGGWEFHQTKCKARKDLQEYCFIDVDRLGIPTLQATSRMLEMTHLGLRAAPLPAHVCFKCSHGVANHMIAATVMPTFPTSDPSDKRLRNPDRLRAGEMLVKALARHIRSNARLTTLEVLASPLRLFDWQHIVAGLRHNGCPLRHLSLAGSALGDAGLHMLAPALLHMPTLVTLNLNSCGLSTASAPVLVSMLQSSNLRQNKGRLLSLDRDFAAGLCGGRSAGWPGQLPAPTLNRSVFDEMPDVVGLTSVGLAGNSLGEAGAHELAAHLAQDDWLQELDLRRNGIGALGLEALRSVAADRVTAERDKYQRLPPLKLRLEGNAEELTAATERLAAEATAEAAARSAQRAQKASRPEPRPASARASTSVQADERMRDALRSGEAQVRALSARHRAAVQSSAKAALLAAGVRAAANLDSAPMTRSDWAEIVEASGGAAPLLDAMEHLIGAALRKITDAAQLEVRAEAGCSAG